MKWLSSSTFPRLTIQLSLRQVSTKSADHGSSAPPLYSKTRVLGPAAPAFWMPAYAAHWDFLEGQSELQIYAQHLMASQEYHMDRHSRLVSLASLGCGDVHLLGSNFGRTPTMGIVPGAASSGGSLIPACQQGIGGETDSVVACCAGYQVYLLWCSRC